MTPLDAKPANPSGGMASAAEMEKMRNEGFLRGMEYGLGGSAEVLRSLKDPELVRSAIKEQVAAMVGLPAVMAWREINTFNIEEGVMTVESRQVATVSHEELMQIFLSPDFMANRKGAGYMAQAAVEQVCNGTTRDDVLAGIAGPGKFSAEEAIKYVTFLIADNKLNEDQKDAAVKMVVGKLKPEAMEVAEVIRQEAKSLNAVVQVWSAFQQHQSTAGDEEAGASLFVEPSKVSPMGADWLAFFDDDGKRDAALRQIYATGLTMKELRAQGKEDLAIEGIHFTRGIVKGREKFYRDLSEKGNLDEAVEGRDWEKVDIDGKKWKNVYANGFDSQNFKDWMGAVLNQTDGDLLAAYEAWYTAITTGLVAKVAVDGVSVGDPPMVSSIHAWLMHFREKQLNEAGKNEKGERAKKATFKGKTGPVINIDKYPPKWIGSFFDSAEIGDVSVFDMWWKDNVQMSQIPWLNTDQTIGGQEEEVRLGSYDGWLYKIFQMNNLLKNIQKTPALKDLSNYDNLNGLARQLDKAFGVAWKPNTPANKKEAAISGVDVAKPDSYSTVDGVEFVKAMPDEDNVRFILFVGLLTRYAPVGALKPEYNNVNSAVYWDAGISPSTNRLSMASEDQISLAVDAKAIQRSYPGEVAIDTFISGCVNSGMLTTAQAEKAMREVYNAKSVETILKNSNELKRLLETK